MAGFGPGDPRIDERHRSQNEVLVSCQNVTAKVSFKNPNLFRSRKLRRPRFSFSIFNCQKTDEKPSRQRSSKTKTRKSQPRKSASANLGNSRAKVIVASSAAALVSDRAYRPPPSDTSTAIFKKMSENRKPLIRKECFQITRNTEPKLYYHGSKSRAFRSFGDEAYMVNGLAPFKGLVGPANANGVSRRKQLRFSLAASTRKSRTALTRGIAIRSRWQISQ